MMLYDYVRNEVLFHITRQLLHRHSRLDEPLTFLMECTALGQFDSWELVDYKYKPHIDCWAVHVRQKIDMLDCERLFYDIPPAQSVIVRTVCSVEDVDGLIRENIGATRSKSFSHKEY